VSVPTQSNVLRRERAIRLTVVASVGAKAVSGVCTLVQVPLALHYLGTEAYGFWVTLFSIVIVLNFVDFGLGAGMQHAMARAYGSDDMESMKRVFWTGAAVLGLLGLLMLAAGLPAALLLPWSDILHIHDAGLRAETGAALAIAVAAVVAGLPFNGVARLAAAVQRGWLHAGWIAAGSAISLAFVAAAAFGRWGFLWFVLASLLVPCIQGLGLFVHLLRVLGWRLRPSPLAPASEIRGMLRSSLFFAFPQLGQALVQAAPALAISLAAGSSAVTGYTLLMRLFGPFQQGQIILLNPVWPAYTEAHARGDHPWVSRAFWRTGVAFIALAAGVAACAWQSQAILRLWIGPSAVLSGHRLAALTAVWCVLQMAAQPLIYYLIGTGRLRQLAWAATPGLLVSAAALFWASRGGTVDGVIGAGSAGLAVALLPPLAWATVSAMRRREQPGLRT
jgi:O-antigen/teichoic acid export membrane protein